MIKEREDENIEIMRLLLVAQLAEITGMIWTVITNRDTWDVQFLCRFGQGEHPNRAHEIELKDTNYHIVNGMSKIAWGIAKRYWKYMDLFVGEEE